MKSKLFKVVICFFLFGCSIFNDSSSARASASPKAGIQEIEEAYRKGEKDSSRRILQVAKRYTEAWNSHDVEAIVNLYAENVTIIDPNTPVPASGRDYVRSGVSGFLVSFPDLKVEMKHCFVSGNVLICEGVFLGTNDGPMGDIPPTGKRMELRFSLIAIIDSGGLISEERSYYDNAGFLSQLGLME